MKDGENVENTNQQEDGRDEETLNSTDILDDIPSNIKVQQPASNTGNQFSIIQKNMQLKLNFFSYY